MNRRKFLFTVAAVGMIAAAKTTGFASTELARLGQKHEYSRVVGYDEEQDYTCVTYTHFNPNGSEFVNLHRKSGGDFRNNDKVLANMDRIAEYVHQQHVENGFAHDGQEWWTG